MRKLLHLYPGFFVVYTTIAAFGVYFCMYALRKPFTAGVYDTYYFGELGLKAALIMSQVVGYLLAKYIGIKIISELGSGKRGLFLMFLATAALIGLLLQALLAGPLSVIGLFINGLSLGMVWGVVFSYLEGRKYTEILAAGLSVSFIVSSGILKSIGLYIIQSDMANEFWMPVWVGLLFLPFFGLFVWMLEQIPPPSAEDVALRQKRFAMGSSERRRTLRKILPPLALLVLVYVCMTVLRDIRDSFGVEIWRDLGFGHKPMIFSQVESVIGLVVLVLIAALVFVRSNRRALGWIMWMIALGVILCGGSTLLYGSGKISVVAWMFSSGLGLFMAYVPFNCVLFDRLIPVFKLPSNAGYLIYIADAVGYSGSLVVILLKSYWLVDADWLGIFEQLVYFASIVSLLALMGAAIYFNVRIKSLLLRPATAVALLLIGALCSHPRPLHAQEISINEDATKRCAQPLKKLQFMVDAQYQVLMSASTEVNLMEMRASWLCTKLAYDTLMPPAIAASELKRDRVTQCVPDSLFTKLAYVAARMRDPDQCKAIARDALAYRQQIAPPAHRMDCRCSLCKLHMTLQSEHLK